MFLYAINDESNLFFNSTRHDEKNQNLPLSHRLMSVLEVEKTWI